MVGNNHIHAKFAGMGDCGAIGNTAIHRQQQLYAFFRQPFKFRNIQTVSFALTLGQMPCDRNIIVGKYLAYERGGSNPVHIVIAPYGKFFSGTVSPRPAGMPLLSCPATVRAGKDVAAGAQ